MNTTKEPMPSSRQLLFPGIAAGLKTLATTLDTIAEPHHSAGQELAAWIAAASNGGRSIIVVCTGSSGRGLVGALMGQAAATYYGLPQVRFFSGGTAPSAFKCRTIPGPPSDWLRDRARRRGGPAQRAEPSQSQVSHPVGSSQLKVNRSSSPRCIATAPTPRPGSPL